MLLENAPELRITGVNLNRSHKCVGYSKSFGKNHTMKVHHYFSCNTDSLYLKAELERDKFTYHELFSVYTDEISHGTLSLLLVLVVHF